MIKFDARGSRRIYMRTPATALFLNRTVEVHDLATNGFGIVHDFPLRPGDAGVIEFRWGRPFALRCVVVRCKAVGTRFRSGLAIQDPSPDYVARVAEAVARKAAEEKLLPPVLPRS